MDRDVDTYVVVRAETDRSKFPLGIPDDAVSVADKCERVGDIEDSTRVEVLLPRRFVEGLDLRSLATVFAEQSAPLLHREPRGHLELADQLLHLGAPVPSIDELGSSEWRLPSASAGFWNGAEFPRDTAMAMHMLRYLAAVETANGTTEPYIAHRVDAFGRANLYRMLQLQGCVDKAGDGMQKVGRIPHEHRPPSVTRDELSLDWSRTEWPVYLADDTSVLALGEAVAVLGAVANDCSHFLATKVAQVNGDTVTVADAVARLIDYVIAQVSEGDGLVFVHRDVNDSWMTWTDSVLAYRHEDGTLPLDTLAPVELQGWVYDALTGMADLIDAVPALCDAVGTERASAMRSLATKTATHLHRFVVHRNDEPVWLANAVERTADGALVPLAVAHANMGMVLNTGWIDAGSSSPDDVQKLVEGIAEKLSSMATAGGVPTMEGAMFGGYHNGAIWPWVQGYVAMSFARRGLSKSAATLLKTALIDRWGAEQGFGECVRSDGTAQTNMATIWTTFRLPDGHESQRAHPLEQLSEADQMWTVIAYLLATHHDDVLPADLASSTPRNSDERVAHRLQEHRFLGA